MIEITGTELRRNMVKYFDLAIEKKEQVIVRLRNRGDFYDYSCHRSPER